MSSAEVVAVWLTNQFALTWDLGLSWILMSANDLNTFGQISSTPGHSAEESSGTELLENICLLSADTWLSPP